MKKKILLGLAVFSALFLASGAYVVFAIQRATSSLDNLIKLHQVEILREHLLLQIKDVQADLAVRDTPYARSLDATVAHSILMDKIAARCADCHHSAEVEQRLASMRHQLSAYKEALSRVLTTTAGADRLQAQKDRAFHLGERLISKVNEIVALTTSKLERLTQGVLRDIAATKAILFVLLAAGPMVSIALAYVMFRGFTNPLQVLLDAARKLQRGELDHRVGTMRDEFGELAGAFNEMAESLQNQMLKLQRTEQMVVAGELAAGLAHEIKNPLAGIKVAMNVLAEECTLGEEERAIVAKVTGEVKRLEILMKSFLNFAKPTQPQWQSVDVNQLVRATLGFHLQHSLSVMSRSQAISVVTHLQELPIETTADPMKLQQVLLNLLLNAVSAMPQGGTLTVNTIHDPFKDIIGIEIADTGLGIDAAVKDKIFQPFFTTKSKGTGLGLAICKQFIEQHGGSIRAENQPMGGALFRVELPCLLRREAGGQAA